MQRIEVNSDKGISWNEISYIRAEENTGYPVLNEMLDRLPRYPQKGKGVILKRTEIAVPHPEEDYILDVNGIKLLSRPQPKQVSFTVARHWRN